jgi:hypothetical protein
MHFTKLSKVVSEKIDLMAAAGEHLYEMDLAKDELWQVYLSSFPEGTNPLYKERTEHDCSCCKNFIRDIGGAVTVKDGRITSIWDVQVGGYYQVVVDALSQYVKSKKIKSVFFAPAMALGAKITHQQLEEGTILTWNHFYGTVPQRFVLTKGFAASTLSEIAATVAVFKRGLEETPTQVITTVLDLIQSNALYRGEEFKGALLSFLSLKQQWVKLNLENPSGVRVIFFQNEDGAVERSVTPLENSVSPADTFVWENFRERGARIRNTVIGSLLQDLAEDQDLEKAVRSYEAKVAPTNYKRPTALITKRMIEDAMMTVNTLGIEPAFSRRFAVAEDISINNVLFADRSTAAVMKGGLLTGLLKEVKETVNYDNAEQLSVDEFIKKIIPKTQTMEILLENKHVSNMVSLIAAKEDDAPQIFKWDNRFSWSYRGNVTDSIRERVKKAGGNIEAELRVSLAWFNHDDLDLHVVEPHHHIHFAAKRSVSTKGFLDVDMNANPTTREPVENVAWAKINNLDSGPYRVFVQNFNKREHTNVGFEIEIELKGIVQTYFYEKAVSHREDVTVLNFVYDKDIRDIVIPPYMLSKGRQQEVWGIKTGQFHKVSILTISPNYWDENKIGNKHYLFMLEGCVNEERPRGFYNEFLRPELEKHRKVFEVLGEKTKCDASDRQLSGVGFSSTKQDVVVCRCNNRIYKVSF